MGATRRPPSPAPLPGFSSPAAGFDQPMEMLAACHDRVRRSLSLLAKIGERIEAGPVDAAVHSAAADVVRYFDQAAPHHHEDEEQHVFPRLLEHGDAALRAVVLQLQEDHLAMEAQWRRLRTPLAALAEGHADGFGPEQLALAQAFVALYRRHMTTEETLVFPAAAAKLDDATLRGMGHEMATRRGAKPR
jgi:hemerythrin-like domain-containing protein